MMYFGKPLNKKNVFNLLLGTTVTFSAMSGTGQNLLAVVTSHSKMVMSGSTTSTS